MTTFTESQLERAIIDLLQEQNYPYVPGVEITRTYGVLRSLLVTNFPRETNPWFG